MSEKISNNKYFEIETNNSKLKIEILQALELKNAKHYDTLTLNFSYLDGIDKLIIHFGLVPSYDSYFVIFVLAIKKYCEDNDISFQMEAVTNEMEKYLDVLTPRSKLDIEHRTHNFLYYYLSQIGNNVMTISNDLISFVEFIGDMTTKLLISLFQPQKLRWKSFPDLFIQSGVNAVPIVTLIVFLIGLISGYQSAVQLSQVGADIFIADLVGISITRELGPLMVAIIIAGRSGSSFTAEIGTMKVSEEVDALKSMGFDTQYFLVLPRLIAVLISIPILTLLADLAGIIGGLLAAISMLNLTIAAYMNEIQQALSLADVYSGLIKSFGFGFIISAVGCFRGFQVESGAESVGKYTTASVVTSIFLIIVTDFVFTFIFQALNI